jgi:prephenate dehydratase
MDALHPGGALTPVPCSSIEAAFDAVRTGLADRAVVPIENSVEGGVNATMDELAAGSPPQIYAEVLVPVEFALLARPDTTVADVKVVGGHPVAAPQCRRWLAQHVPDARWQPALSNAEAARQVADFEIDAALAGGFAASHYDLVVLAGGINDKANAVTRFVEVGPAGPPPAPTRTDRTSVIAFLADDHPGALMDILGQFAVRGVNLSRIESRPTGEGIGRYCFFIDCEGHVLAPSVGEALMGLRRACIDVRFLGSYARANGAAAPGGREATTQDTSFADAASWLERIRSAGTGDTLSSGDTPGPEGPEPPAAAGTGDTLSSGDTTGPEGPEPLAGYR